MVLTRSKAKPQAETEPALLLTDLPLDTLRTTSDIVAAAAKSTAIRNKPLFLPRV